MRVCVSACLCMCVRLCMYVCVCVYVLPVFYIFVESFNMGVTFSLFGKIVRLHFVCHVYVVKFCFQLKMLLPYSIKITFSSLFTHA